MTIILILPLTLLSIFMWGVLLSNARCYFPDETPSTPFGDSIDTQIYQACNSTSNGVHSACCAQTDICTTNSYCFGGAGVMYRGGCTDISWKDDVCCPHCVNGIPLPDSRRNILQIVSDAFLDYVDNFDNMLACPVSNGTFTSNYCCGNPSGDSCCSSTFSLDEFPIGYLYRPEGEIDNQNPTTQSKAFLSSTTVSSGSIALSPSIILTTTTYLAASAVPSHDTTPSAKASSSKEPMSIGIGIGVPTGVFALSGLAFLFLKERRLRMSIQKSFEDILVAQKKREGEGAGLGGQGLDNHTGPSELEHAPSHPRELELAPMRPREMQ